MRPQPTAPPIRRLIGYARVSTEDQATDAQVDELKTAGCRLIHQEHRTGASRSRPVLGKLMREIAAGDGRRACSRYRYSGPSRSSSAH